MVRRLGGYGAGTWYPVAAPTVTIHDRQLKNPRSGRPIAYGL